jgi:biopolymer transport protein ExbD
MSHSGSASSAVPNLTPLLDVVLQLLMFFMMCVNFVGEQFATNIQLPASQIARPEKAAQAVLVLNVNRLGEVDVFGQAVPLAGDRAIRSFLKQEFDDDERIEKGSAARRSFVIRADQSCDYEKIYDLLSICKEIGYRKLRLAAIQKAN